MAHSSPGRWLAPAALLAAFLALVVVLAGGLGSSSPTNEPSAPPTVPASSTPTHTAPTTSTPARSTTSTATYTVQAGDYLSTVAEKTGVSVDRLRALNPGLDANAMHVGQKIRLHP